MKTPVRENWHKLTHITTQTGDLQAFAITPENYDPKALETAGTMTQQPVAGFSVALKQQDPDKLNFIVMQGPSRALTSNDVVVKGREPYDVELTTTLLTTDVDDKTLALLADLEQCVALGLLGIQPDLLEQQGCRW